MTQFPYDYGYDPSEFFGVGLGEYLDYEDEHMQLDGQMTIEDEHEAIDLDSVERARRQRERVIDALAED